MATCLCSLTRTFYWALLRVVWFLWPQGGGNTTPAYIGGLFPVKQRLLSYLFLDPLARCRLLLISSLRIVCIIPTFLIDSQIQPSLTKWLCFTVCDSARMTAWRKCVSSFETFSQKIHWIPSCIKYFLVLLYLIMYVPLHSVLAHINCLSLEDSAPNTLLNPWNHQLPMKKKNLLSPDKESNQLSELPPNTWFGKLPHKMLFISSFWSHQCQI